jgi:hypothetical protein
MTRICLLSLSISLALISAVFNCSNARGEDWYTKAVKSFELTISPAEVKPGETVTVRITLQLDDGYHTYPLVQPDKKASDQVNKLTFPFSDKAGLILVGDIKGPTNPIKKAEPVLGIKEMHIFEGIVSYEQKAVISPKAQPGELTLKGTKFDLLVCDDKNCFPPKKLAPEAKWTVKMGAPVEVAKEYQEAVQKVLNEK